MSFTQRLRIPIWREGRVALERSALTRSAVWRGEGLPRGDGGPVMLIPGFLAGDLSLGLMARWLRGLGYRPTRAGIRANVGCTARAVTRLEAQLHDAAERHGRPVSVVGHSRGGTMARILAVRHPELVQGVVCLGSPLVDQFDVHPLVRGQIRALATLGTLGVPGLFTHNCRNDCCEEAFSEITAPYPPGAAFTSIFSRSDGIVSWRACLDPAAEHVEVRSTHIGMAVNLEVYRAVAEALTAAEGSHAAGTDISEAAA